MRFLSFALKIRAKDVVKIKVKDNHIQVVDQPIVILIDIFGNQAKFSEVLNKNT